MRLYNDPLRENRDWDDATADEWAIFAAVAVAVASRLRPPRAAEHGRQMGQVHLQPGEPELRRGGQHPRTSRRQGLQGPRRPSPGGGRIDVGRVL